MHRHQVLTGSTNAGNHCYSVGEISQFTFWAYGSGCDLVISTSSQQPIQVIPGCGNVLITAVSCTESNGKIAVAYEKDIIIYHPVWSSNRSGLSYKWHKQSCFQLPADGGNASILSWNQDEDQLLVASSVISLWLCTSFTHSRPVSVSFHLDSATVTQPEKDSTPTFVWKQIWSSHVGENPVELAFSPVKSKDCLFASVGQGECMIKVWYTYKKLMQHKNVLSELNNSENVEFTFTYLLHPEPVVGFEWRKNCLFDGIERFSNVLISSSCDQICRVWVETKQPRSRLMRFQTVPNQDEVNRKRKQKETNKDKFKKAASTPMLSDDLEVSFSNPLFRETKLQDAHHFHIAATINPLSDIPLLPSIAIQSLNSNVTDSVFTVHWLNNKYYDHILMYKNFVNICKSKIANEKSFSLIEAGDVNDEYPETFSSTKDSQHQLGLDCKLSFGMVEKLINSWRTTRDALFSIHPTDGSLLMWHIEWLDEERAGLIRQPQVCFSSRIPMVFPSGDAATLCPRVILFANNARKQNLLHSASSASFRSLIDQESNETETVVYTDVKLLSKHNDGSLNLWQLSFTDVNNFSSITSISHSSRFCGHCFHMSKILTHPVLPLLATTATHSSNAMVKRNDLSELILWRVDPVGPLSHCGGLSELAKVGRQKEHLFTEVAWFPFLFPSWSLGIDNKSPSTALISLSNNKIQIYQAVVDANQILSKIMSPVSNVSSSTCDIISQQSSVHPGCLLHLLTVDDKECDWGEILFLEIFSNSLVSSSPEYSWKSQTSKFFKQYYIVMLERSGEISRVHTWKVIFSGDMETARETRKRKTTVQMMDSSEEESEDESFDEIPKSFSNIAVDVVKLSVEKLAIPSSAVIDVCSGCGKFNLFFTTYQDEHVEPVPYHFCTLSSDGSIYFWVCSIYVDSSLKESCKWTTWNPIDYPENLNSDEEPYKITVTGTPVLIKAANSTLLACMCIDTTVSVSNTQNTIVVYIYECASTGGSAWKAQDTIHYDVSVNDLQASNFHLDWLSREEGSFFLAIGYKSSIQIFSLAPKDIKAGSISVYTQQNKKQFVRQNSLDVHTRQKLFTGNILNQSENSKSWFNSVSNDLPLHEFHWRLLRWTKLTELNVETSRSTFCSIESHADEKLASRHVTVSWTRDGILVVASETEMHVHSQWMVESKSTFESTEDFAAQQNTALTHGLSELAEDMCPSLQQYHPLVLSELMNSGHLDAVREILIHLAVCMNGDFYDTTCEQLSIHIEKYNFSEQLSNVLQLCSSGNRVTPFSLHELVSVNGKINHTFSSRNKTKHKTSVSNEPVEETLDDLLAVEDDLTSTMDEELDEILGITPSKNKTKRLQEHIDLSKFPPNYFGKEHCRVIHEFLIRNQLPGLTSLDQMELMALADTLEIAIASNAKEASDNSTNSENLNTMTLSAGERGYAVSGGGANALDNCGLRFIMSMHNHLCLLNSLPASDRMALLKRGLDTCQFAWAFHSETEEEMLSLLPSIQKGAPDWSELRSLGAGWWIRSTPLLKRLVEQIARAAFLKNNDPLDAALFYLALNKKSVLCGLFRSVKDTRMNQFFQHNFVEERWRRAALKNAFALMGKQRFQHAAAFFLLAGSVKDAVEVCIHKLKDIQLALLIVRLRDKPDVSHHQLLMDYVLKDAVNENSTDKDKRNSRTSDSFTRSMAYWTLGDYDKSLSTLLDNIHHEDMADVFNFYIFLRSHPIVLRNKAQKMNLKAVDQVSYSDILENITEQERQLIFQTAVVHLEAGCPMLALDCLSKLPNYIKTVVNEPVISQDPQEDANGLNSIAEDNNHNLDTVAGVDWSQPVTFNDEPDELELDWSDEEEDEDSDDASRPNLDTVIPNISKSAVEATTSLDGSTVKDDPSLSLKQDVFAQQLKMTACYKIFVQELKSIANAYNTDGGQLRSKLYTWLENASNVLHRIFGWKHSDGCNVGLNIRRNRTCGDSSSDGEDFPTVGGTGGKFGSSQAPSLHELILADNHDWKTRQDALARRRKWLQSHHNFLRTLLSYCNLHDSAYGLLATMKMELLLLLQESLQDKRVTRSLVSPLPSPLDSIPLVQSSIACCKTVVADPLTHLCHMTSDILKTALCFTDPPHPSDQSKSLVSTKLCSQAAALSTCIYQSLCDTSTTSFRSQLLKADTASVDGFLEENSLSASPGNQSTRSVSVQQSTYSPLYIAPTTLPSQWPGVAMFQALINSESSSSDSRFKIIVLLCEATVGVYVSLLIHALQTHNTSLLYRVANHVLGTKMWNAVFGGGVKVQIKYAKSSSNLKQQASENVSKIRDRLTHKVLSASGEKRNSITSSFGQDSLSYRETFVPPEIGLWDWFLTKPMKIPMNTDDLDYDSDAEDQDSSEVSSLSEDDAFKIEEADVRYEQFNADSYSWKMIRYVILQIVINSLQSFLPLAGYELSELNTYSPLLSAIIRMLQGWQSKLKSAVEDCGGPPADFLPSATVTSTSSSTLSPSRPAMLRYQAMLEPDNTPFVGDTKESLSCQRLWHSLVKKEALQEIFIKYIFQHKKEENMLEDENETVTDGTSFTDVDETLEFGGPAKILHKDNELIAAFCINNINSNCVALASPKDIQEIDLSDLLASETWAWLDESNEKVSNTSKDEDFLFVSVPSKPMKASQGVFTHNSTMPWSTAAQNGQGANVLMKRPLQGVCKMESHPTLPYYLTGNRDGAIHMWEWTHQQQISQFQSLGPLAKINNIHFSSLGNKVCSVDGEGILTMWQVSTSQKPFFRYPVHDRTASDFCFISSSSVIATAGLSSTHRNVRIWDTLMPRKSLLVKDFSVYENVGASCVKYLSRYHTLLVTGKNGHVTTFDDRCLNGPLHKFIAHDASIKCVAIEPNERYYVTGSVLGDVKIWDSLTHKLLYHSANEHARSSLFRNFGFGTVQATITTDNLLTCGADGSLKMKPLPPQESW